MNDGFWPKAAIQKAQITSTYLVPLRVTDRVMGAVWGRRQAWNFLFGRGAKGGKFV